MLSSRKPGAPGSLADLFSNNYLVVNQPCLKADRLALKATLLADIPARLLADIMRKSGTSSLMPTQIRAARSTMQPRRACSLRTLVSYYRKLLDLENVL